MRRSGKLLLRHKGLRTNNLTRDNTTQHHTIQHHTIQHNAKNYHTQFSNRIVNYTIYHIYYSILFYSTLFSSILLYSTLLYSTLYCVKHSKLEFLLKSLEILIFTLFSTILRYLRFFMILVSIVELIGKYFISQVLINSSKKFIFNVTVS